MPLYPWKIIMIKKISIILAILFVVVFTANISCAQESAAGKASSFRKNKFSSNSSWDNTKGGGTKKAGPPGAGGGGGGNPIPISGGLAFLLIGSVVYFGKKVSDENR